MAYSYLSPGLYRNSATGATTRRQNMVPRQNKLGTLNANNNATLAKARDWVSANATSGGNLNADNNAQLGKVRDWITTNSDANGNLPAIDASKPFGTLPEAPKVADPQQDPVVDPNEAQRKADLQKQMMDVLMGRYSTFGDSAQYNKNVADAQKRTAAFMAARGLSNSGFEVDKTQEAVNDINAQEQIRADQLGQQQADRLYEIMNNEQQRKERSGNTEWQRMMDLLTMGKSYADSGLSSASSSAQNLGTAQLKKFSSLADYLASNYARVYGGGGGGGAPYIPPMAGGPDTSISDQAGAISGATGNVGYGNIISQLLGSIFA